MAHPLYPDIGQTANDPPPPADTGESTGDLQRKLDIAQARADQAEELLRAGVAPKPPPALDTANLGPPEPGEMPDNVSDPDAFRVWMEAKSTRDKWEARNYTDGVRDSAVNEGRSNQVIDDYLTKRPNYQPLRQYVFQAFTKVCFDMKMTSIPDDTTVLDAAVDKEMLVLMKAAASSVDELPTGDETQDRETPPERTGGLSGGSKGASAAEKAPDEEDGIPIVSLQEALQAHQAKSGLF